MLLQKLWLHGLYWEYKGQKTLGKNIIDGALRQHSDILYYEYTLKTKSTRRRHLICLANWTTESNLHFISRNHQTAC